MCLSPLSSPNHQHSTDVKTKKADLCDLQAKMLSAPRKERAQLRTAAAALESEIQHLQAHMELERAALMLLSNMACGDSQMIVHDLQDLHNRTLQGGTRTKKHTWEALPLGLDCSYERLECAEHETNQTIVRVVESETVPQDLVGLEMISVAGKDIRKMGWNSIAALIRQAELPLEIKFESTACESPNQQEELASVVLFHGALLVEVCNGIAAAMYKDCQQQDPAVWEPSAVKAASDVFCNIIDIAQLHNGDPSGPSEAILQKLVGSHLAEAVLAGMMAHPTDRDVQYSGCRVLVSLLMHMSQAGMRWDSDENTVWIGQTWVAVSKARRHHASDTDVNTITDKVMRYLV